MEEIRFDWSTAQFEVAGLEGAEDLVLEVALDGAPDFWWADSFRAIVQRSSSETGGVPFGSIDGPHDGRVKVRGFDESEADALKETLDTFTDRANHAAPDAREAAREKNAQDRSRAEQLQQVAQSLTERFRKSQ